MNFSIVVAATKDGIIGCDGKMPWHLPKEYKWFQKVTLRGKAGSTKAELTTSNHINIVIMGRNTWESLPRKPLPNRINVVLTSDTHKFKKENPNISVFSSLDDALNCFKILGNNTSVFVIGGATLYNEAMKHSLCKTIYYSQVNGLKKIKNPTVIDMSLMDKYKMTKSYDTIYDTDKMTKTEMSYQVMILEK